MKFNIKIAGIYYTATNEYAITYWMRDDRSFAGVSASSSFGENRITVALSGWQETSTKSGCLMSETIDGYWIDITDGWSVTGYNVNYSVSRAQELVNGIIKNNETILCNNILCARYSNKLTEAQKRTLYELQSRLNARNEALLNKELVSVSTVGAPSGYAELEGYLTSFMQSGGVGSLSIATIVIVATVIVAAGTAAYLCYKKYYDESVQDVKYSNELTKVLASKLTDEEYQQLMRETRNIVTKASIRSRLNGGMRLVYFGAALLAGGALLYYLNKRK